MSDNGIRERAEAWIKAGWTLNKPEDAINFAQSEVELATKDVQEIEDFYRGQIDKVLEQLAALQAENEKYKAIFKCNDVERKGLLAVGDKLNHLDAELAKLRNVAEAAQEYIAFRNPNASTYLLELERALAEVGK